MLIEYKINSFTDTLDLDAMITVIFFSFPKCKRENCKFSKNNIFFKTFSFSFCLYWQRWKSLQSKMPKHLSPYSSIYLSLIHAKREHFCQTILPRQSRPQPPLKINTKTNIFFVSCIDIITVYQLNEFDNRFSYIDRAILFICCPVIFLFRRSVISSLSH